MITYLLELKFAVDKAQGLMGLEEAGQRLFPNIENFKSLQFTSDVGVAEVAAAMMAITGPSVKEMVLAMRRASFVVANYSLHQPIRVWPTPSSQNFKSLMLQRQASLH